MIDFSKIRSYKGSQSAGFEELICQLGRRDQSHDSLEFRRVEGAGGDGGVEAYWKKRDGSEIGYQAKYFLKSGDIDWSQVDKSVKKALQIHTKLSRYVIAIPCDLTDKKGTKGKTGWEHWETHKATWNSWAAEQGVTVDFEVWSASDILDRLTQSNAYGLERFWFGRVEFSNEWYQKYINEAVARLGERYHPEDHVNVTAQAIECGIVRHPFFIQELQGLRTKILKIPSASELGNDDDVEVLKMHLGKLKQELKKLGDLDFDVPCEVDFPIEELDKSIDLIKKEARLVQDCYWKKRQSFNKEADVPYPFIEFRRKFDVFEDNLREFYDFVRGNEFLSNQTKFVVITGSAGTGKSHLSAFFAESALAEQRPVFLFNGYDFENATHAINKISDIIDKGLSHDEVFGAINAAGELARVRALIIIDAINEGAGSNYWLNELAAFVTTLNRYPYIACILTCRKEYADYAIPKTIEEKITKINIRGFSTPEEQEAAARVYLDKRGISRPATPWLNPEFINPLFLRSVTTALQRDGKTEFPRGLTGTSAIFAYFVEATASNMCHQHPNLGHGLHSQILESLQNIATEMLLQKQDRISLNKAVKIVNESFGGYAPLAGMTWLDVLIRNGLLQCWPVYQPEQDPLKPPQEAVTFSFQRFQDHVMATQLFEELTDPVSAFEENGEAAFCLKDRWQWSGLFSALSVIIPEKYGKEWIDCLPQKEQKRLDYSILEAFKESVRWRNKDAFTEQTRKFLNLLPKEEALSLVLEMSICEDHPFNVENLLHPKLMKLKMPERDAWWSTILANSYSEHPIYRIIDWSLEGSYHVPSGQAHELAALVLAWSFSTTDRNIRDRATKSLVALVEKKPSIFSWLVDEFKGVDDLYILERIYAAAYGAACRNFDAEWVTSFAETAFNHLFSLGKPLLHLLLRDYARGLIEICKTQNRLPECIEETLIYPPYNSSPPKFNIQEEAIQKIADKAGGKQILYSCTGFIGDFGIYEIDPATRHFLTVPLTREVPLTAKENYDKFKQEIIEPHSDYKRVFDLLEAAQQRLSMPIIIFSESDKKEAEETTKKRQKENLPIIQAAKNTLFKSFSENEKVRYYKAVKPYFEQSAKDNQPRSFELKQLQRWVARRAYGYGWKKFLFENEPSKYSNYSRERPIIERIGKKYQWLALSELQCRLADNYWLQDYGEPPRKYDSPLDIGLERDIDPTITQPKKVEQAKISDLVCHIMGTEIDLGECEDKDISHWPFLVNPGDNLGSQVYRSAPDGRKFSVLYEHRSSSEKYLSDDGEYRGEKRQEFRLISSVIVLKSERNRVVDTIKKAANLNFDDWDPIDFIDRSFLLEYPWHYTWDHQEWDKAFWNEDDSPQRARTVTRYLWESHLDKSMPEGCTVCMPSPWLCKALELKRSDETATQYFDKNGSIALYGQSPKGGTFVGIETELFEQYLKDNDYECLWVFLAERNTFLDGRIGGGAYRRIEGVAWRHGRGIAKEIWNRDRP
jgi:predicted ATPase